MSRQGFAALRANGITVVFSSTTHAAAGVATRVVRLANGMVTASLDTSLLDSEPGAAMRRPRRVAERAH